MANELWSTTTTTATYTDRLASKPEKRYGEDPSEDVLIRKAQFDRKMNDNAKQINNFITTFKNNWDESFREKGVELLSFNLVYNPMDEKWYAYLMFTIYGAPVVITESSDNIDEDFRLTIGGKLNHLTSYPYYNSRSTLNYWAGRENEIDRRNDRKTRALQEFAEYNGEQVQRGDLFHFDHAGVQVDIGAQGNAINLMPHVNWVVNVPLQVPEPAAPIQVP